MSCQIYSNWEPKNLCKKTTCPPETCNSNGEEKCTMISYISDDIDDVYKLYLTDIYSNMIYIIENDTTYTLYFPYESKNLLI